MQEYIIFAMFTLIKMLIIGQVVKYLLGQVVFKMEEKKSQEKQENDGRPKSFICKLP